MLISDELRTVAERAAGELERLAQALNDTGAVVTAMEGEIARLEAEIARLTALIEGDLPPAATRVGAWCYGPDLATWQSLESNLGLTFDGYRPRGNFGQPEPGKEMLKNGTSILGDRPGSVYSTNINPRIGEGGSKVATPYRDWLEGKYDWWLDRQVPSIGAYPGEVINEDHSEADVLHAGTDAQPAPPDLENFVPWFKYVVTYFRDRGIGAPKLRHVLSLTWNRYTGNDWHRWFDGLEGYVDILGVDGYDKEAGRKTPATMLDPAYGVAQELGLPMVAPELGTQEVPGDRGAHKAQWFGLLEQWVLDHPKGVHSIWLNHGDSANGAYRLTTSPAAQTAAVHLINTITTRPSP